MKKLFLFLMGALALNSVVETNLLAGKKSFAGGFFGGMMANEILRPRRQEVVVVNEGGYSDSYANRKQQRNLENWEKDLLKIEKKLLKVEDDLQQKQDQLDKREEDLDKREEELKDKSDEHKQLKKQLDKQKKEQDKHQKKLDKQAAAAA